VRGYVLAATLLILGCSDWAANASPYATDDPEIIDANSWQLSVFSQGNTNNEGRSGTAVGVELDYGILPDLQAGVSLPVGFSAPNRDRTDLGMSDIELGVKYNVVQGTGSGMPQISFCPSVEVSFGASAKVSDVATHFFFPLWAEELWDTWTLRGGSGYRTNPAIAAEILFSAASG